VIIQANQAVVENQLTGEIWLEIKDGLIASINHGLPPKTRSNYFWNFDTRLCQTFIAMVEEVRTFQMHPRWAK
jgi:hypothetical protein